jgi:uncharacterized protein (DUF305 family)
MKLFSSPAVAVSIAAGLCLTACGPAKTPANQPQSQPKPVMNGSKPKAVTEKLNDADLEFMSGMIPHHAQAVLMAGWAESHGARQDVRILCERIVVGQRDEIKLMQMWLEDHGQAVPDAKSTRHHMVMNGMAHDMLMPGMLSDEEMAVLDKARGPEWDKLFLLGMIRHHQGAIDMVNKLFASRGGGQEQTVFKFASDVFADQSTEIDRMHQMLEGKAPSTHN